MFLGDYMRLLKTSWRLITTAIVVGIGAAALILWLQVPKYTATSAVFVTTTSASNVADLTQAATFSQQAVKSYAAVATSPYVLKGVISRLNLQTTPAILANDIDVVIPYQTSILDVSVTSSSPLSAAEIANAVSAQLTRAIANLSPNTNSASSAVQATQITPASVPSTPTWPNYPIGIVAGLFAGLVLGVMGALGRRALDTRIHTLADLRGLTDVPVLGSTIYAADASTDVLVLRKGFGSGGPEAEAFRSLSVNLTFVSAPLASNSFAVTSPEIGEGKTTLTANLGAAIAESGASVLVVDADLRRPRIATLFGLDGTVGLSNVLVGEAVLDSSIQRLSAAGLSILPAGAVPPNPSELLRSNQMADLVRELATRFDVVLFDTPPVLPVSDAAALSTLVSGVIVACRSDVTRRAPFERAIAALRLVDASILGVVLTAARSTNNDSRYYYAADESNTSATSRRKKVWHSPSPSLDGPQ